MSTTPRGTDRRTVIRHINLKEASPFFLPNMPGTEIHRQVVPIPEETRMIEPAPDQSADDRPNC